MLDLVEKAMEEGRNQGASFSEARYQSVDLEEITVRNGEIEQVRRSSVKGVGIRTIAGGWGFASTTLLTPESILQLAGNAVRISKASARTQSNPIELADEPVVRAKVATEIKQDPFSIPIEEKLSILIESTKRAQSISERIKQTFGHFVARRDHTILVTSEGSNIDQTITWCGGGVSSLALEAGDAQTRSLPSSFRGDFATRGYDYFLSLNLMDEAEKASKEAVSLLEAQTCPTLSSTTLILVGSQLALQIHESCGHPTELDRALGHEAAFAGTSFLVPSLLGTGFQYGNDQVTMTADATIEGALGHFFFDHEGVEAQRTILVDKGEFTGYMSSRETAAEIGLSRSSGAMRAMSHARIPLIRMTNVNLEPGDWEYDELIEDTKDGFLFDTNRSWSIDDIRLNFQFGTEIGYRIKNGEIKETLKNPTYTGITPEFWGNVDGSCKKKYWKTWGTPNCGKGEPGQAAYVGHGCAPTRFRDVRIGVMEEK